VQRKSWKQKLKNLLGKKRLMTKPKIQIYSTATCPACLAAKAYLDEKGFKYDFIDVGADDKMREEMVKKAGGKLAVPTIDIDGTVLIGFDKPKIDELLGIK